MPQHLFVDAGGSIALPKKAYSSPQGHIRVDANVTRVGVLRYYSADGTYKDVLRHPDEVFNARSLESLAGVPVTIGHPVEDGKNVLVSPANFQKYGRGVVGDRIKIANPYVQIEGLNIQTQDAFEALGKGNKQVSPGYLADVREEAGTWENIPYTHRQYGVLFDGEDGEPYIHYNHLAIMRPGEFGRSGAEVRVLMDGGEVWQQIEYDFSEVKPKYFSLADTGAKPKMKRSLTLHGDSSISYEISDEGMVTVPAEKLTALMTAIADLASYQQSATATLAPMGMDSVNALADAYNTLKGEKAIVDAELAKQTVVDIAPLVAKRLELERTAGPILGDSFKADMSDRDLMVAVVKKYEPSLVGDSTEDAELIGLYRAAAKILTVADGNVQRQATAIADANNQQPVTDARGRMNNFREKMRASMNRKPMAGAK